MKIIILFITFIGLSSLLHAMEHLECQRVTLSELSLERSGGRSGRYSLDDGKGPLVSFNSRRDALYAQQVIQDHHLSLFCHLANTQSSFLIHLTETGTLPDSMGRSFDDCHSLESGFEVRLQRRLFQRHYLLEALTSSGKVKLYQFENQNDAYLAQEHLEGLHARLVCQRAGFSYYMK